jgi:hypothetical protein
VVRKRISEGIQRFLICHFGITLDSVFVNFNSGYFASGLFLVYQSKHFVAESMTRKFAFWG